MTAAVELSRLGLDTADLADIVARSLGWQSAQLDEVGVTTVPYDIPALTTLSRDRVQGLASDPSGRQHRFSIFVKVLRSWELTPEFQFVPEGFRAEAAALLPWEVEALVYRSDLAAALPDGLAMPACWAVRDLSPMTAALWLEDVTVGSKTWRPDDLSDAARLLAHFAVDPEVAAALAPLKEILTRRTIRTYVGGRVRHQVVPLLRSDQLWTHPLVDAHFGPLRPRLLRAVDRLPELVGEIERAPVGLCHGDASTNNLLRTDRAGDALVLIDFGFLSRAPLGFDLGQLTVGEHQLGDRDLAELEAIGAATLAGYAQGLAEAGRPMDVSRLRRTRALCLTLFSGLSAIPFEHLMPAPGADPVPPGENDLEGLFAARAGLCRWILDELDATEPDRIRPTDDLSV